MSPARKPSSLAAVWAVFALLAAALAPAAAAGHPADGLICTALGVQNAPAGDLGEAAAKSPCKLCISAAPAPVPETVSLVQGIRYAVTTHRALPRDIQPGAGARAPPRPPGQGPPNPNA